MKKRFMSFFLVLVMVLTVVPVTAAGAQIGLDNFKTVRPYSVNKFQDVPAGSWFYDNVKRSYELNLIDGRSDTSYAPYENMTIAEAIKIAACLHSIYYTGTVTLENGNPWHRPYVDYALEYGIISSEYANYWLPVTRAQFAQIFANALPNDALKKINNIENDIIPDVPSSASYASAVYKLYRAGVITGNDDKGTFSPSSNILRSEVAAIVTRMADESLRQYFTLQNSHYTAEEIFNKCSPAVFYIELYNASGSKMATGSGFFINSSGTAVTNFHVIEGASSAKIRLSDGREFSVAGVYDYDESLDLALIKINGSNFPYLEMGDSTALSNGATIYAIGSPLGLESSITDGVISNKNRVINGKEYIQVSASISPGSSGGALINTAGQVIGVTSAYIDGGQNLNLAVPIHKINGLETNRYVPLSSIKPSTPSVTVSTSPSSVTVPVGYMQTIQVNFSSGNYEYASYDSSNRNIAAGAWNQQISETSILFDVYGMGRGTATLTFTALDASKNPIGSTTITVYVV